MKEGWIKRITITADHVEENGQVLSSEDEAKVRKTWAEEQQIDLSIWGTEVSDTEVLKFLERGKI